MQTAEVSRFMKPHEQKEKRSRASKIPRLGKKYDQLVDAFCELDPSAQSEETFLEMAGLLKLNIEKCKKHFKLALTLFAKRAK